MKLKSLIVGLAATLPALMAQATDYSVKSGEVFTLTSANNNDSSYITAADGAIIETQSGTGMIYARILNTDGGTVTIRANASGTIPTSWQFANGIRAKSNGSSCGTYAFEGMKTVKIGRASVSGDVNYPVCELSKATFTENGAQIILVDKVTVRALPSSGCAVSVQDGATVALQSTTGGSLLGFFSSESDALTLENYDVILCKQGSLPDACRIAVGVGRTFAIRSCSENGWEWAANGTVETKAFDIRLAGKGAKYLIRGRSSQVTSRARVSGQGEIVIQSESGAFAAVVHGRKYQLADATKPVVLTIDNANFMKGFAKDTGWKRKVAHWFDASKAETLVKYDYKKAAGKRYEYLGEHDLIVGWKDAVKATSDDIFLYNRHAMNGCFPEYLPYVVEGGLNGLSYVSFGKVAGAQALADADHGGTSANECRWLRFVSASPSCSGSSKPSGGYTTTTAPCVIMVFGSQNGGGKAILDTVKPASGNTGNLARSSSSTSNPWTAYNAGFGLTTDGVGVTPNSVKPNGDWQIVSLDASKANAVFEGLGAHQSGANVPGTGMTGGMNYAEVIFFSEEPTEEERIACECYLAEKWGLKSAYSCVADVSPCVSVEGGDNATIYVNSGSDFAWLDGDFSGTVNVSEGKDLLLDEKPLPPTEKDVPQDGLVGWYDPSFAGALTYHKTSGHTDEMEYLYNRTLTDVTKSSGYKLRGSAVNGEKTRSPNVVKAARGGLSSSVRPWLDFSKDSGSANVEGNTIRLTDATAGEGGTARSLTIRQGFIALDSSLGGGNPIGDNVEFSSGKIRRRTGNDVTAPIWSSNNTIAMTSTWLDTTAVDGTKTGFNGRPEVLSFTTAENYNVGYFGDYNGNKGNYEILGEILLYSSPLPDAARTTAQEYLMYKWFADRNGKYSNLAGATVTGAGRICVQNLTTLPKFSPDFSGSVALCADELSLSALAPTTLLNDVELPDAAVLNVTVDETVDIGTYPLLTATGTLSGASSITVNVIGGSEQLRYRVRKDGSSLVLAVAGRGLAIILR